MELYEFDEFQFDARARILFREGKPVALTPKAADLLAVFLAGAGQVLLKEDLLANVWPGASIEERNLNVTVHYLRKALGLRGDGQSFIENIPKRGYRFAAPVRKVLSEEISLAPSTPIATSLPVPARPTRSEPPQSDSAHSAVNWSRLSGPAKAAVGLCGFAVLVSLATIFITRSLGPTFPRTNLNYLQLTHNGLPKDGPLLTDGIRIFFMQKESDRVTMASVGVNGGETSTLPVPVEDTQVFDLSPLRSEILVATHHRPGPGGEVWVLPLFGGSPRRVGTLMADRAAWSPDKTRIASVLGTTISISDSDGAGLHRIATTREGHVSSLRWSPDQKRLRFTSETFRNGDSQQSIWEVNVDGSSLHPLLPGWSDPHKECCGSWSQDGGVYVFQATPNGHSDVWAILEHRGFLGVRTSEPVRLSSGPLDLLEAMISSDAKRIFVEGTKETGELVRYDSGLREFVKFLGGIPATWVTFSGSGRSVAYIHYPDLTIWKAKPDGSEEKQVTFAPLQADGFSWAPDENSLAVRARTPGKSWNVYLVSLRGGEPRRLIPDEKEQGIPSWSSDGTRLCFGDVPAVFERATGNEAIHVFDLRTHTLSDLPGSSGLWTPRWSPNGRYIAALTIKGQKLRLFDFSENVWRSTAADQVNTPNWSSDSKFLYFDTEPRDRRFKRLRLSDGTVSEIVDLNGVENLGPWWSGLGPDNSLILLRNRATPEIYSISLEDR